MSIDTHVRRGSVFLFSILLPCSAATNIDNILPTPKPAGPYHISGNRILDADGHAYLIRGTRLPTVSIEPYEITGSGDRFGALSMTTLATVRYRINMNAVRLPVIAAEYEGNASYRARVSEIVRKANLVDLLVILASAEALAGTGAFWNCFAMAFRDNPNVFFALSPAETGRDIVSVIRSSGAMQPIVVPALSVPLDDSNLIYEAVQTYANAGADGERWEHIGALAEREPVLVDGLDPEIDTGSGACAAFPGDPGAATKLIEDHLIYFDAHHISWTISSFQPGRLITDYHFLYGTKLDYGWTCGQTSGMSGIGMVLLSHLWSSDPHGLFTAHIDTGGFLIARGGIAAAYGPILADKEMGKSSAKLPLVLGNVSVRITDSQGAARLAPLLHTGAGWSYINFVVPETSALGPATVEILRSDGSSTRGRSVIGDVVPGVFTAPMDGRGAVTGWYLQGPVVVGKQETPVFKCSVTGCFAVAIPLSRRVATTLRIEGTGFRHARSSAAFRAWAGDVVLPVLSFGPVSGNPGRDQLTVQLPQELIGAGEVDLYLSVDGLMSNIARINTGTAP